MLNIFYWYSLIWGVVLFLYSLGWSSYNKSLESGLLFFLLISIIISFFLGYIYRNNFKYKEYSSIISNNKNENIIYKHYTVIVIVGLTFSEFIYTGYIPLFSIIRGQSKYGDYMGIPIIHSLLENLIIFCSSYLFYLFLEKKDKRYLIDTIIIISMFLLMYHKGALIFCLFIIINLFIAKMRLHNKLVTPKRIVIILFIFFAILYINGGLTNLRNGYEWNNESFITRIGGINTWPSFVPSQFAWAYVYITSPLANLNLMAAEYSSLFMPAEFFVSCLPVFLSKRLFPSLISGRKEMILNITALNASTGYDAQIASGGILGIWLFFIYLISIFIIMVTLINKKKARYSAPFFAIMSMQMVFMFFYNTLTTAATSWLVIFILLYTIKPHIKIKIRN